MRFTIPWGIFPTRKTFLYRKSPPPFSLWEIPCFFIPKTLWGIPTFFSMGNPHYFSPSPPMGNSPKKSGKKFFFGIYGQLFPQKWGCPLGRGGMGGIPTPPYGVCGGGDYLLRLLVRVLVRVLLV